MKKYIYILLSLISLTACTSDDMLMPNNAPTEATGHHRVPMRLMGQKQRFNDEATHTTRATTTNWQVGDKIYINFNSSTKGTATYTSTGWVVEYDGAITTGEGQKCSARYFENPKSVTDYLVQLDATSARYEAEGTYNYVGGELTLYLNLQPATGRVRFKGTAGSKVYVAGPQFATSYTPSSNKLTEGLTTTTLTIDESGYTPYVYGTFLTIPIGSGEKSTTHFISVACGENAYTRICTDEVLSAGNSGYYTVPTETAHTGWRTGFTIRIKGYDFYEHDFKMMPVAGYTTGFFLLGETEVTSELYQTIMSHSTSISNSNMPEYYLSVNNWLTFINELNSVTGLNFYVPLKEEWDYAAQGGKLGQGCLYAGSNNVDDVAWTSENASVNPHDVKTKLPNELGIYDMSGNVNEIVYYNTWKGYVYIGGSIHSNKEYATVQPTIFSSTMSWATAYNYVGLRLALRFN